MKMLCLSSLYRPCRKAVWAAAAEALTRPDPAAKLPCMGRVLAVDWGKRRVGLAISDETRTLARPLETLADESAGGLLARLEETVRENSVEIVVVGQPLHMSGKSSSSARSAERLARDLAGKVHGVRVVMWDERLTSREAAEILRGHGEKVRRASGRLDEVAATVLLQAYLDSGAP